MFKEGDRIKLHPEIYRKVYRWDSLLSKSRETIYELTGLWVTSFAVCPVSSGIGKDGLEHDCSDRIIPRDWWANTGDIQSNFLPAEENLYEEL